MRKRISNKKTIHMDYRNDQEGTNTNWFINSISHTTHFNRIHMIGERHNTETRVWIKVHICSNKGIQFVRTEALRPLHIDQNKIIYKHLGLNIRYQKPNTKRRMTYYISALVHMHDFVFRNYNRIKRHTLRLQFHQSLAWLSWSYFILQESQKGNDTTIHHAAIHQ